MNGFPPAANASQVAQGFNPMGRTGYVPGADPGRDDGKAGCVHSEEVWAKAMSGTQSYVYMKMLPLELQMVLHEWDQAIAWYFFTWDLVLRMGLQTSTTHDERAQKC